MLRIYTPSDMAGDNNMRDGVTLGKFSSDLELEISDSIALIKVAGALQKEPSGYYFWMEDERGNF